MQDHGVMHSSGPIYLIVFSTRQYLSCCWQWMLLQLLVTGILWNSELLSETQLFGYSVYFRVLLDTPLLLPTYSECPFVVKMLFLLFQSFPEYF